MIKLVKLGLCCIVLLSMVTTAQAYEGYAPLTSGGDGGTVVTVTNVNDYGAGSLRAAVDALDGTPTTIRFSVGGTINLTDMIWIIDPNVTIDGTTAPAPGITLNGANITNGNPTVRINTHDVIVKNIRIRNNGGSRETIQVDGDWNIILDHLSVSGSADGALDINNGTQYITISNCLFAESVEGHRSYGKYASLHHNLYSYINRRQPKIVNYEGPYDFRNNVIRYWTGTGTNVEAGHQVNIINNYYGPTEKICASGFNIDYTYSADVYISGNYFTCGTNINDLGDKETPNTEPNVTTMPADANLLAYVLDGVGTMPRDAFDESHAGSAGPTLPGIADWLKGSIHYHTTNSDGSASVETMVTSYRDTGGHAFSCVTDHDYISDANAYTTGSFIGVNGVEASTAPHVVGFGVSGSGSVNYGATLQAEIDNVITNGGLPMVAHVYWSEDYASYDMDTLLANMTSCNLISIYNYYCEDIWGNGNSETYWDTLLTNGKAVYGYAEDDTHGTGRMGYTFNMVGATELTLAAIKTALQNGEFYFGHSASRWGDGITVSDYTVTGTGAGDTISITTNGATTIKFIGQNGSVLQTTDSNSAIYTIAGNEPYVRIKATNTGGDITWMQPVFIGGSSGGSAGWSETADYYVDGLTGDDGNAGTSDAPWATLTKAVSTATAGDKVLVWGGQTYTGQLVFSNSGTSANPITFRSDPNTGYRAIIDGNAVEGGALYTTTADYIVIDNFRITNATYGVYIYGDGADGWTIENCTLTGNTGHGVYIRSGDDHSIFNNTIYDNGSTFCGIYIYNGATNCDIAQCSVYGHKYGIRYALSCSGDVKDSIVTDATTYGVSSDSSTVTTTYSDVWNNGTNYYGCSAGTGCISSDPLWGSPDNGDFTLGSGSPCIGTASDDGDMGYRTSAGGASNQAPSVNAGQDQEVTLPNSASLDGTVSDDGLPNPPGSVTTTWTKQSGPGTVTFGNANAVDTTASFSTSGTYVLRLTADDSALQSYDEVTITVNPAGPSWSESADYYVDGTSGNDNNAGTSSQPWATLTKAVSSVTSAGKKVLVWGGQTYTGYLKFDYSGTSSSPITFKRDPSSGEAVINGNATTYGALYTTKADYIVIDGFKLTNSRYGAYIYGDGADAWTIKNCRITGNSYYGIYSRSGDDHLFFNSAIYGNGTNYYGIYIYSTALNNDITQCSIYKHKYGIYYYSGCSGGDVKDSIITSASQYGIRGAANDVTVTYSDVWGNGTNYYGGVSAGTGCISSDPEFVDPDNGDFHLTSGSPCEGAASDSGDMGYRYSSSAL